MVFCTWFVSWYSSTSTSSYRAEQNLASSEGPPSSVVSSLTAKCSRSEKSTSPRRSFSREKPSCKSSTRSISPWTAGLDRASSSIWAVVYPEKGSAAFSIISRHRSRIAFIRSPAKAARSSSMGLRTALRFFFRPAAGKEMGRHRQAPSHVDSRSRASSPSREAEMEGP